MYNQKSFQSGQHKFPKNRLHKDFTIKLAKPHKSLPSKPVYARAIKLPRQPYDKSFRNIYNPVEEETEPIIKQSSSSDIPVLITGRGRIYYSLLPEANEDLFPLPPKKLRRSSNHGSPFELGYFNPTTLGPFRSLSQYKNLGTHWKLENGKQLAENKTGSLSLSITPQPVLSPRFGARRKKPVKLRPLKVNSNYRLL